MLLHQVCSGHDIESSRNSKVTLDCRLKNLHARQSNILLHQLLKNVDPYLIYLNKDLTNTNYNPS